MADTNSKLPFLEIIEWVEPDPNLLMWKVPDQDKEIKNGAKLIVRESQTARMFSQQGRMNYPLKIYRFFPNLKAGSMALRVHSRLMYIISRPSSL